MAVKAVFFDVGETLVDETGHWAQHAERLGVTPHVVWAAVGAIIARGEHHRRIFELLGGEPDGDIVYSPEDFYPDALPCLERLHGAGYVVGIAGNQSAQLEDWIRSQDLPVDVVASSASWGVEKPSPEFFARVVEATGAAPHEVAYVGDRLDNDVLPALEAGLVAVRIRRGPWGHLQAGHDAGALRIRSLDELPEAFDRA
jgi:FMN phosphatase YigB (HAD superfamily)